MTKNPKKLDFQFAPDVAQLTREVLRDSEVTWVNFSDLFFIRSQHSSSRAIARIWGFPRIWQLVLEIPPKYIIEVVSEKFDHLADDKKYEVIAHEVNHIPKNFSGALLPHIRKGKNSFKKRLDRLIATRNIKNRLQS